jgi:hypothetical protein
MRSATRIVVLVLVVAAGAFLLTHIGAYPWIQSTMWYSVLATFVALNTIGFATLAAGKLGFRRARQDARRAAEGVGTRAAGGVTPKG